MKMQSSWMFVAACAALAVACQRVDRVELSPHTVALKEAGASATISAKVLDQNGKPMEKAELAFSSSKPDVAVVGPDGKITAKKSGVTQISAKTADKEDSVSVDVRIPAKIVPTVTELKIVGIDNTGVVGTKLVDEINRPISGAQITLAVADVTKAIVQPDNKTIVAKGAGDTIVTATAGAISTPIKLTVALPDFATVALESTETALKVGATQPLTAAAKAADGTVVAKIPFAFTSSDAAIATVDAAGVVTAVAAGKATITAAAGDKNATVALTIKKK